MLPIDLDKFHDICLETAKIWVLNYQNQKMTPTVHKVLIHGAEIMANSVLPVGILSEEAAESRNKFYRNDRLNHARKTSRIDTITDLFHRQLDTSDPLISSQRLSERINRHKPKTLPLEVQQILLINCDDNQIENDYDQLDSDSDEQNFYDLLNNLELDVEDP